MKIRREMDVKYILEVLVAITIIFTSLFAAFKFLNNRITDSLIKKVENDTTKLIDEKMKNLILYIKRIEISNMIFQHPGDFLYISELYDEYKALGGNSYIDFQYNNYIKERELNNEKDI
jgi:hypothetical protein